MKKVLTSLILLVFLLFFASFDLFSQPINEVVLNEKSILLKNGMNRITLENPEEMALFTYAVYTPSFYPTDDDAFYTIKNSLLKNGQDLKVTKESVYPSLKRDQYAEDVEETAQPSLRRDDMEAELFYETANIKFFFLSGGGYPDVAEDIKAYYRDQIAEYAEKFELILEKVPNFFFGQDYVDVDGNGCFEIYVVNAVDKNEVTASFLIPSEFSEHDRLYLNTRNLEYLMASQEGEVDGKAHYERNLKYNFAYDLFCFMNQQTRDNYDEESYFLVEGMAAFATSLMEKEFGEVDQRGSRIFENAFLYHPMKSHHNRESLLHDGYVGSAFWAYIWNVYGEEAFRTMVPCNDAVEAIETVLGKEFRTVYRDFLLSMLGTVGQPVEGHIIFPDAALYQQEDEWILLQSLVFNTIYYDYPGIFLGGDVHSVETEIAPLGYDVRVWYENPEILTVDADPGVEVYAFTAYKPWLDYLFEAYDLYQD